MPSSGTSDVTYIGVKKKISMMVFCVLQYRLLASTVIVVVCVEATGIQFVPDCNSDP